jgi:hypothetical protein
MNLLFNSPEREFYLKVLQAHLHFPPQNRPNLSKVQKLNNEDINKALDL